LPLRWPAQHKLPQRCTGAWCVIWDRIGPGFDAPGEGPGDARGFHCGMETREFRITSVEGENVHGFAGCRCFTDHRDRVCSHEERISEREKSKIRIIASAVPD